jgi:hypothetical protein
MASKTANQTRSATGSLTEQAKDVASAAGQMADKATSTVGGGLESAGQTLHRNAPSGGMLGSAAQAAANTLESGGRYMRQEGVSGMTEDLTDTIRNNPLSSFLIAVTAGYLLAQITRG